MTTTTDPTTNPTPATDTASAHLERLALLAIIKDVMTRLGALYRQIEPGVHVQHERRRHKGKRVTRPVTCGHPWKEHLARGMCNSCWIRDKRMRTGFYKTDYAKQFMPPPSTNHQGEAA